MRKTIRLINSGQDARDVARVDARRAHDSLNYEVHCVDSRASFAFEEMSESFALIVSDGAYVLSLARTTKSHIPFCTSADAFNEEQSAEYLRADAAHCMAAPRRPPS
jgi:hypothetical protein